MRAPVALALALLCVLWLPAVGAAAGPASAEPTGGVAAVTAPSLDAADTAERPDLCVGTIRERPDESTLVSVQGAYLTEEGYLKRPALLTSYAPDGSFEWTRNGSAHGRWWAYDVDRQPDGSLLWVTTETGITVVGALDPDTREYRWTERFEGDPDDPENPLVTDAHDADLLDGEEIIAADKGEGHERLLLFNRTEGRVTWEWRFEDHPEHFPESGGGPPEDWTHVNDVDRVNASASPEADGEGEWFMASVRNFDQIVFVNRSSGAVELTLGADENHDVLHRQHNPDHLWGPDGEHTVLVSDSLNDRVVEYAYDHGTGGWERVWQVTGLNEPRDADRLPSGNTLVTDRQGHRVLEVTPHGEVVWEVYTPYEPYDAERGGPGSEGPTMREQGVDGSVAVSGSAGFSDEEIADCAAATYGRAPSRLDVLVGKLTGVNDVSSILPYAAGALLLVVAAVAAILYWVRR